MAISQLSADSIWKVYYYIALFATVVFVLKLVIFTFVGGDSEVVADFNVETDSDVSFNFISVQSVLAFLMGFGWMGYAGLKQFGLSQLTNLFAAFAVGLALLLISAFLMFLTRKLEKNIKKDKTTALNKVGKAYTSFAPGASGQVEIEVNGQLSIVNALNNTEEQINSFDAVKVVNVVDDLLYIEKV